MFIKCCFLCAFMIVTLFENFGCCSGCNNETSDKNNNKKNNRGNPKRTYGEGNGYSSENIELGTRFLKLNIKNDQDINNCLSKYYHYNNNNYSGRFAIEKYLTMLPPFVRHNGLCYQYATTVAAILSPYIYDGMYKFLSDESNKKYKHLYGLIEEMFCLLNEINKMLIDEGFESNLGKDGYGIILNGTDSDERHKKIYELMEKLAFCIGLTTKAQVPFLHGGIPGYFFFSDVIGVVKTRVFDSNSINICSINNYVDAYYYDFSSGVYRKISFYLNDELRKQSHFFGTGGINQINCSSFNYCGVMSIDSNFKDIILDVCNKRLKENISNCLLDEYKQSDTFLSYNDDESIKKFLDEEIKPFYCGIVYNNNNCDWLWNDNMTKIRTKKLNGTHSDFFHHIIICDEISWMNCGKLVPLSCVFSHSVKFNNELAKRKKILDVEYKNNPFPFINVREYCDKLRKSLKIN